MRNAMGTRDLLEKLRKPESAVQIVQEAKEQRRSVSAHLERISPTDKADRDEGMDAFSRLMREADVVTRSIPEEGIYADSVETMTKRAGRAALGIWAWRQYRAAQRAVASGTRAMTSLDNPAGSLMRPYADNPVVIDDTFQPAIPVSEVLASSDGIDSDSFRTMKVTEPSAGDKRFVRVGELGEIPKVTITVGEQVLSMYKFGRGIAISDEAARRQSLDRVARMIQKIAVGNDITKLAVIIEIIVSGDEVGGNGAATDNLSTLDPASAGSLTPRAWIKFRWKWENPYVMTTVLAREDPMVDLSLLNTGSANLPTSIYPAGLVPSLRPINPNLPTQIAAGETSDSPANALLGFDRRATIARLFEIGAETREVERTASSQETAVYLTEVEGYYIVSTYGARLLNLVA